jgi:hypothetical protein
MATTEILEGLHAIPEGPWTDLKGKPLNDRGLATRLRRYEIQPKVVRIGTSTIRGYLREDMVDAWARYLSASPRESATSETGETEEADADDPADEESWLD